MGTVCTTPTGSPSITHRYRTFHLHCHHQGIHQDLAPPFNVAFTSHTFLGMMKAAEQMFIAEKGPIGLPYIYIKKKIQELLERTEQLCQPEDRSATRCMRAPPRPPPPFIPIPPAHFDLHDTDIAARRQSPYNDTGITTSLA